jgi:hypothetical protein
MWWALAEVQWWMVACCEHRYGSYSPQALLISKASSCAISLLNGSCARQQRHHVSLTCKDVVLLLISLLAA